MAQIVLIYSPHAVQMRIITLTIFSINQSNKNGVSIHRDSAKLDLRNPQKGGIVLKKAAEIFIKSWKSGFTRNDSLQFADYLVVQRECFEETDNVCIVTRTNYSNSAAVE